MSDAPFKSSGQNLTWWADDEETEAHELTFVRGRSVLTFYLDHAPTQQDIDRFEPFARQHFDFIESGGRAPGETLH